MRRSDQQSGSTGRNCKTANIWAAATCIPASDEVNNIHPSIDIYLTFLGHGMRGLHAQVKPIYKPAPKKKLASRATWMLTAAISSRCER